MGMWGRKDQEDDRPGTGPGQPSQPEAGGTKAASTAPPAQQPRPQGSAPAQRAIIGPSIQVKGELIGREDLVVEGYVEGVIRLKEHHLTVGETADLHATLEAKAIRVEGKVDGDIVAGERVELAGGSTVLGDIKSPRISIADGARFKGSVDMEQPGAGKGAARASEADKGVTKTAEAASKPAEGADKSGTSAGKGTGSPSPRGSGSS
jgi:cytoskeletal protein CcmA (bactofilin family)